MCFTETKHLETKLQMSIFRRELWQWLEFMVMTGRDKTLILRNRVKIIRDRDKSNDTQSPFPSSLGVNLVLISWQTLKKKKKPWAFRQTLKEMGKGSNKFMKNFSSIPVHLPLHSCTVIGLLNVKVNRIGFYWIIGNRPINVVRLPDKYTCLEIEFYSQQITNHWGDVDYIYSVLWNWMDTSTHHENKT